MDSTHTTGALRSAPVTYVSIYINVLPVNNPPDIYYITSGSSTLATDGQIIPLAQTDGNNLPLIDHVSDVDGVAGIPSYTLSVSLTSTSPGASFSTIVNSNPYTGTTLSITSTLANVNNILQNLEVVGSEEIVTVNISINDGGYSGGCPTGMTPLPDGTCPRTTSVSFQIRFSGGSVSPITTTIAAGSAGAFFLVGAAAALVIANKLKNKKKDDEWKEFDEDNFKDVAKRNPIFEDEISKRISLNPLYVSSRESSARYSRDSTEMSFN